MIRTFTNLQAIDPGFEPSGLIAMEVSLPTDKYVGEGSRSAFFEAVLAKITPGLVELALEEWKREMTVRKKKDALPQRRWASSYLRTRALHLSNLFAVLYPDLPNPVLALKDRLPPKSPEVEKAQPMRLVMELLEAMRNAWHNGRMAKRSARSTRSHDFMAVARRVVEEAIGEKLDGSPPPKRTRRAAGGVKAVGPEPPSSVLRNGRQLREKLRRLAGRNRRNLKLLARACPQ